MHRPYTQRGAIDALGVALDAFAAAVPFLPGGVGALRNAAREITAGSRVNVPAWRKIAIDVKHIAERHMPGGKALSPGNKKDIFPSMTETQVERAVRNAYRHGEMLQSQGDRVFVRGPFGTIEMWVNRATKEIESAWPKF